MPAGTPGKTSTGFIVARPFHVLQAAGGNGMVTVAEAAGGGFKITRVQGNLIARRERQLLDWLCARMPRSVTPDRLTAFSVAGAVVVFASGIASRENPVFLWLAALGLVANWFGDSLDGSLARHRRIERPVYGYFLDHSVDALCNLLIMAGLGFTREAQMATALFALVGYFLLCIYVFITNHLSGIFRLSFLWGGPTELRFALVCVCLLMFFAGHAGVTVAGTFVSAYDALFVLAGSVFTLIFLYRTALGIRDLRDPARGGGPAQSSSRNSSRAPK